MYDFLAVLLREGLQFSQEHLDDIQKHSQSIHHEDQIAFGIHHSDVKNDEECGQPLEFGKGRYHLVFKGEIYNTEALRLELVEKGYEFKTESQLEVIGALFMEQGTDLFANLRGMFSMLIWDRHEQRIYGARDPFGVKPLYYLEGSDETLFATEKRHMIFSSFENKIAREALQHYLTYQYVPEPLTLHEGIKKVKPGYFFVKEINQPIEFHRYFHATFNPQQTSREQLKKDIRSVLIDSVNVHMQSDEPLGSLLSGGIDSSLIVALAKEVNPNLKTFSVGFEREGYSEVEAAKETADYLGVENISYIITPEEYVSVLPEIMLHMGDPLADPSCVPLYFAMREARKHVKVVLSGEGADELFGGYNIYRESESLKMFDKLPEFANHLLQRIAAVFPEGMKGKSFLERGTTPLKERYVGNAKMFDEAEKQKILKDYDEAYRFQVVTKELYAKVSSDHAVHKMQYIDIHTWLPGDILLKADKMSKAHSLEVRTPFLDQKVFHVAKGIPVHEKISNGTTKLILREAFKGIVPDDLLYRRKLGFPVPIKHWLKHELYSWARDLILESQTDDLIDKVLVLDLLERHKYSRHDYSRKIWTILMFMLWHQLYME